MAVIRRPSPEEEKRIVWELTKTNNNLNEGGSGSYFAISKTWYTSWEKYVESLGAPRPGPIDNHDIIIETSTQLRGLLVEGEDYVLVSQKVWNNLVEWYNGGPPIPRTLISLFLSDARDDGKVIGIDLAKQASIRELYETVCAKAGVSKEKAHIWDYFEMIKGKLLNPLSNKSLEESGLHRDQDILLEVDGSSSSSQFDISSELGLLPLEPSGSRLTTLSNGDSLRKGLAGLVNLGNTCYMNSALQCLAHTPPIVQYFLQDNPLGFSGELARAFGELLKELWSPGKNAVAPHIFKTKLDKFAPQFRGYSQHDSHELLLSLLAGLHDSRPNDPVIVNICQGQCKSTLVCPVCGKIAINDDSFTCLSLPLPSILTRSITVTVFHSDGSHLPMPYTVTVRRRGSCRDLFTALRIACSLTDDGSLLLAKVYKHKIVRYFENPLESLSVIKDEDHIVAYQTHKGSGEAKLEILHGRAVLDSINGRDVKFFGTPFVTCVNTEQPLSGSDIDAVISGFLFPLHKERGNGHLPIAAASASDRESSFRPIFLTDERYLDLKPLEPDSSVDPGSVTRVLVDWNENEHEKYDSSYLRDLPEVYRKGAISLVSCLEANLAEEHCMWRCPECKEERQANKKLDLCKLPDILVFHLKRFMSSKYFLRKIDTFVDFPINDLDLSKYVNGQSSYLYELYAVSNHDGGLRFGHYTAYVKLIDDDNKWYQFNDSQVSLIDESQIKSSAAYLLFYRRVGSETQSADMD